VVIARHPCMLKFTREQRRKPGYELRQVISTSRPASGCTSAWPNSAAPPLPCRRTGTSRSTRPVHRRWVVHPDLSDPGDARRHRRVAIAYRRAGLHPLISEHDADLVLALERHEALRAMNVYLRDGGALVYYDTVWQPLEVRLKAAPEVSSDTIRDECRRRGITLQRVFSADLPDTRMQNIVLLAHLDRAGLIEGLHTEHFMSAMDDLMDGRMLQTNMEMFRQMRQAA
jgi:Pyruvate/2-oxoacid:ferredoxin oxidoreductase gamma subunit